MDRRTFLLGFLGSLAAAPTIIATASSVEAASVPETLPPVSPPDPEPVSSGEAEVDLEKVEADWSQYGYRRRAYRRGYRRTYRRGYRRAYRRGYRRGYYPRAYYPRRITAGLIVGMHGGSPGESPEGLSPPVLDAALILRDPRLFGRAEWKRSEGPPSGLCSLWIVPGGASTAPLALPQEGGITP